MPYRHNYFALSQSRRRIVVNQRWHNVAVLRMAPSDVSFLPRAKGWLT
jgi:hypothetical protein